MDNLILRDLISPASIIRFLVSLIVGFGGGGGIMYWWLQKKRMDHQQEMELSSRFEERLNDVEGELKKTKDEVDRLKDRENDLIIKMNILINRIERLVDRLSEYDDLSEKEKERLTEIPQVSDYKERVEKAQQNG